MSAYVSPSSSNVSLNRRCIALVGNPNCGKTTLFNALTGAHQRVGNWPGVTVERKSGHYVEGKEIIEVVDLPGVYSITVPVTTSAVDEQIAQSFILQKQADVVINIVDASHLERHLYLTIQLLEMGAPVILVLNMMDVAQARQIHIDQVKLAKALGCPVIALSATKKEGLAQLKNEIARFNDAQVSRLHFRYPEVIEKSIAAIETIVAEHGPLIDSRWLAVRLLEEDDFAKGLVRGRKSPGLRPGYNTETAEQLSGIDDSFIRDQQALIRQTLGEDADILLADTRYRFIGEIVRETMTQSITVETTWTTFIDNIVLHRFFAIPIFLVIMYLLFFFAINIGGAFQDFFDISSQTIFVDGFAHLLNYIGSPAWLTALLANGIGKGINTTITFIPVIGAMFLFLALLEDSGYMARAAFVIDRFMRVLGLPGKAFVPMIVGFGCNVPAVMAARTLENKRDRILTIMMSPFMSCGARLAIYAIFTAAFFPRGGQNIVFALYLIGIAMAVFTGFMLRQTVLKGEPAPLVMELPAYHWPSFKTLALHAWQRLQTFVYRAGKLIVPICVLIGALNALNIDGTMGDGDANSLLAMVGQYVTPVFAPMGIHNDNWPATVGLVTGILAKEVVVGTLNTLYTQMGHLNAAVTAAPFDLWTGLLAACRSIPDNLMQLAAALSNPVLAKAPIDPVSQGVYGLMYQKFDGKIGAFAYLLFVLLYFPCVSTTAAMLRELHRGWSIFSVFWMTGVAYAVAVIFYQAATWNRHPLSSFLWILGMSSLFLGTIAVIRWFAQLGARNAAGQTTIGEAA